MQASRLIGLGVLVGALAFGAASSCVPKSATGDGGRVSEPMPSPTPSQAPAGSQPATTGPAETATSTGGPPDDHVKNKHGHMHKLGYKRPQGDCTTCHGEDLKGDGPTPSCYKCHGKEWSTTGETGRASEPVAPAASADAPSTELSTKASAGGPPDDHVKDKDGHMHKRGYKRPQGDCTVCHGEDLKGKGSIPSCYKCHGREWH